MARRALIIGVSGQDGAFLSDFLLGKGYDVHGTSRDSQLNEFSSLSFLGIKDKVQKHSLNTKDFRNLLELLYKIKPHEIYNLSGQSSVGLSFDQPVETFDSIAVATLNILEAIKFSGLDVKFYNAGSSECFGETPKSGATEETPFQPVSPYATAKAASYWQVANYRKAYGLFACTGILFNHESFLRPKRFVTQKIIHSALAIKKGTSKKLVLGNLDIYRDWGWAPDYVEAMWLMLQQPRPEDFIVATGHSHSLKDFVHTTLELLGLDPELHIEIDPSLFRPSDIGYSLGNPTKAREVLNWKAKTSFETIIQRMIEVGKKS